jgi:hypothetical protein
MSRLNWPILSTLAVNLACWFALVGACETLLR